MQAEFWSLFGIGAVVVALLFTATWWLSLKLNNFSFVDVTWSYSLAALAPIYVMCASGWMPRKLLALAMAMIWSVRLGTYLFFRVRRHHPHEDVRYQVLREDWKANLSRNFFFFFQAQAVLILIMSAPILLACVNKSSEWNALELTGAALWLIGILGEAVSDAQMQRFKADPAKKGKVCEAGLWYWSRHPNYFFESIVWWGFWLFACGSPWGWVTVYAPAMILYFLLRVTGIPLTEKCAVESKGEAYRQYQRTTSAFVPWFKRG
jgi:steroid 5-alpha reductase family enzyme